MLDFSKKPKRFHDNGVRISVFACVYVCLCILIKGAWFPSAKYIWHQKGSCHLRGRRQKRRGKKTVQISESDRK